MDNRIQNRIEQVAARFRYLRFLRITAVALSAAAVLIAIGWFLGAGRWFGGWESMLLVLIIAVALAGAAAVAAAFSYRDPRAVAHRIEQSNPSLRARLLTALDQQRDEQGRLTYLQKRVVDGVLAHAMSGQWNETVPSSRLAWARCSVAAAFVACAGLMLAVAVLHPAADDTSAIAGLGPESDGVEVLPGDIEVERGNSLVITARFAGDAIPSEVALVRLQPPAAGENGEEGEAAAPVDQDRSLMKRNLDDPVFGGYVAAVQHDFDYRIETNSQRSRDYHVTVFEYPEMIRSDALLTPPSYTAIAPKTIENTRRITAVEGTLLTWEIHVNKGLVSAMLVPEQEGEPIALESDVDSPNLWRTALSLTESQQWTLQLRDEAGRESKFPPQLVARVLPNLPAELKLVTATDATVSPIEELPIAATVEDDFGIRRVGLSYTIGTDEAHEVELVAAEGVTEGMPKSNEVRHLVDFERLGAEPDQLLSYHFWAEDIAPDGTQRRTTSDIFFAEVRPFEQIFREGDSPPGGGQSPQQQQQAQQAEELAELQKQIVSATWNLIRRADVGSASGDSNLLPPFIEDAKTILESQQTAIEQLAELTESLPPDASPELVEAVRNFMEDAAADLESAVTRRSREPLERARVAASGAYQALLRLRSREFDIVRSSQQQQQGGGGGQSRMQQQLDQLELKNDESRYETERTAQQQPDEAEQQSREILSRLRDLARRQSDLNKQLQAMQLALEQAQSPEEREEAKRQLQRLREQQQELLRDADELASEMNTREANQAAAAEQLEQTRENLRDAERALEQEQPSDALAAGSRAERSLEQMRDEFRKQTSDTLNETMRQMRDEVTEVAEEQQALEQQMQQLDEPDPAAGLRSEKDGRAELADRFEQQSERVAEIIEKMRETVREAEESEPLLANRLYEAQREAQQEQLDQGLQIASDLLRRGYDPQARQVGERAGRQIERLKEETEGAARSVLGDPNEALARAASELDDLGEQLQGERPGGRGDLQEGDLQEGEPQEGEPGGAQQGTPEPGGNPSPGENPGEGPGLRADASEPQDGQPADGDPQAREPGESNRAGESSPQGGASSEERGEQSGRSDERGEPRESGQSADPGRPSDPDQSGESGRSGEGVAPGGEPTEQSGGAQSSPGGASRGGGLLDGGWADSFSIGGGEERSRPITGEGYREWSDNLRQVEDMLDDPELRSRAAGIRDHARELRREVKRHAAEPRWSEIEDMVASPLRELRMEVAAELLRRSAERNAVVPIDRDPVPEEFTEAVRKYYEQLGSGR